VIKELLEMPSAKDTTLGLPDDNMRVTQIITYSYDRDVKPFDKGTEQPSLDSVYGAGRMPNYGLFQMDEAWPKIHIGF
jgi:hypothetical protein